MGKSWGQSCCPTGAPLPWLPRGRSARPCLVIACPRPSGLSGGSSWAGPGDLRPSIAPASREEPPGLRSWGRVLSPCLGVPQPGALGLLPRAGGQGPVQPARSRGRRFVLARAPLLFAGAIVSAWLPVPRKQRPVPFPRVPRWGRSPRAVAPAHPGPCSGTHTPPPPRRARCAPKGRGARGRRGRGCSPRASRRVPAAALPPRHAGASARGGGGSRR